MYCISQNNVIYMSAFICKVDVCSTNKSAIQVNKVGLKPITQYTLTILKPRLEGFTGHFIDVETLPLPYKHLL